MSFLRIARAVRCRQGVDVVALLGFGKLNAYAVVLDALQIRHLLHPLADGDPAQICCLLGIEIGSVLDSGRGPQEGDTGMELCDCGRGGNGVDLPVEIRRPNFSAQFRMV